MARKIPETIVTHARVSEMTPAEYRQCSRLGYTGDSGCIKSDLASYRSNKMWGQQTYAIMVKDTAGRIRSWGLLSGIGRNRASIMLWTQHRWRRMGLARKVIERTREIAGDDFYHYADRDNRGFFEKVNLHYAPATRPY